MMNVNDFLHILFGMLQEIVSIINYILMLQKESSKDQADVFHVFARRRVNTEFSNEEDFLSVYCGCIKLLSLISQDNISLYTVKKKKAIFVDCGNVDVFNQNVNAFAYNAQYENAKKVITVPIDTFNRISKYITVPNIPIVHVANHGRCGSTLLARIFAEIPNAFSISETNPFTDLAELSRKASVTPQELQEICRSVLLFTIKHANARKSSLMFFKCQSNALFVTGYMLAAIPTIHHIYMYRQPKPFIRSYEKLFFVNNSYNLPGSMIQIWAGLGANRLLKNRCPNYTKEDLDKMDLFQRLSVVWVASTVAYLELSKKFDVKTVKFEDLLSFPCNVIKKLCDHVGINANLLLPHIESVMQKDSQAGTLFTSRHVDKKLLESSYSSITPELQNNVNKVCAEFSLPYYFWDEVNLPNNVLISN